jgi:Tfp pilus assembly protein FimT
VKGRFGNAGITFAEVAVTLSLTSILLAAAWPVLSELMNSYNLRGATHEIFAEMQRARLAAVMQNNPYRFYVVSGSGLYKIHDDVDADYEEDDGEVTTRNVQGQNRGVLLSSPDVVTFLPNGTVLANGTIVVAGGSGAEKSVEVRAGGSIRIQ